MLRNVGLFSLCAHVRSKSDNVTLVFEEIFEVDKPDEIFHKFDLLLERRLNFDLLNLGEGFTHYGNKHVHEDDYKKESGDQERCPQEDFITFFVCVVIIFEVALRKHVNRDDGIDVLVTRNFINIRFVSVDNILIQDQDEVCES